MLDLYNKHISKKEDSILESENDSEYREMEVTYVGSMFPHGRDVIVPVALNGTDYFLTELFLQERGITPQVGNVFQIKRDERKIILDIRPAEADK